MVREFYDNCASDYVIQIRGTRVNFSYKVINELMRFPEVPPAEYDYFLRRPNYRVVRHRLCEANSVATWDCDTEGCHKHMHHCDFNIIARMVLHFINCYYTHRT